MSLPPPYAQALAALCPRKHLFKGVTGETVYWEYGRSDAPTIVAVHGFRGDHHGLEPLLTHLGEFRVIVPDLPGFGESPPLNRAHDLHGYVAWLREFVSHVSTGPSDPVVLGHSFGSIIASAAVGGGLSAGALILVNPIGSPALQGTRAFLTRLAIFYYWLATVLPEKMGYALLRNKMVVRGMSVAMTKTRDKALRKFIHAQHGKYFSVFGNRKVVLEAFDASVRNTVADFAPKIAAPTLLVVSEKDDITPLEAQFRLHTMFSSAVIHVIERTGHLIHYETPGDAALAIRGFLAALPVGQTRDAS